VKVALVYGIEFLVVAAVYWGIHWYFTREPKP